MKGLRQNGVEVVECQSTKQGIAKYRELIEKHGKLKGKYDALIVGFPGYTAVILARFLTQRPIIFDAFVSQYDSLVHDRKQVRPYTLKALWYRYLDWVSVRLADRVLLDTDTHIKYFLKMFGSKKEKYLRVLVGSDPDEVHPVEAAKEEFFTVHFHGNYIPLQGVQHIIEAARMLEEENVVFNLVGDGQEYKKAQKFAEGLLNVSFLPRVPYAKLKEQMCRSHVVLGIFGDTDKAKRVIPNKVYEALAVGAPVVTGDSPAFRECFKDKEEMMLVPMADAKTLAEAILTLRDNEVLRKKIAEKGHVWFKENATPEVIGRQLKYDIIDAL